MFTPDRSSTLKEAIVGFLEAHQLLAKNADGTLDVITIRELPMFDMIDPRRLAWGGTIEAILLDAVHKKVTVGEIMDGQSRGPDAGLILNFLRSFVPVAGDLSTRPAQIPTAHPPADRLRHSKRRDFAAQL